uniref:RNA methyltransferase n=1 Tax=Clastoptera arizonana TaxID=38151 RepID=A0A1B6CFH9_9HEMI
MSAEVQVAPKVDLDKPCRRSKENDKPQGKKVLSHVAKKHKHDLDNRFHRFNRKRSQSFNASTCKFFPPYKKRKKGMIIPPTKFLLGGNIHDPLNLNSLQDEEINRAMNAVTPKSSPLPTPKHRKGEIEVIIPPNMCDPLNLAAGDDDAEYEAMLASPVKRAQKKQKNKKKRRSHRSSGSGKEDSIEGAKSDEEKSPVKETNISGTVPTEIPEEPQNNNAITETEIPSPEKEKEPEKKSNTKDVKKPKQDNTSYNRTNLRKLEMKERKLDLDKIVSPVIPQPGAWGDSRSHRFRNQPQRLTPQINKGQATPKFKPYNAKFQFGNYNRYYGYRNAHQEFDIRLKVLERQKELFIGKDVLDIGCNVGHVTLAIARDFGPSKVVGVDIDRSLIEAARTNIRHYVNSGKKDRFFPVSMPIVYGPVDIPGVSEDTAFPHNVSFIQGNYVLDSDVLLSMEISQFDVILCLSVTKWVHLNWGDAGLKRAFKRMYAQLRPGGVLILEAQPWCSYKKKKNLTETTWTNYKNIELFPHKFTQFLLSEVGFSTCELMGSPLHHSQGFQRAIRIYKKGGDTPTSERTECHSETVAKSASPKEYGKETVTTECESVLVSQETEMSTEVLKDTAEESPIMERTDNETVDTKANEMEM